MLKKYIPNEFKFWIVDINGVLKISSKISEEVFAVERARRAGLGEK